jgi:hypothetical protein
MSWYGLFSFRVAYVAVATLRPGMAAVIAQGGARDFANAPAFIATNRGRGTLLAAAAVAAAR